MCIKKSLSLAVAAILTMPAGYAISAESAENSQPEAAEASKPQAAAGTIGGVSITTAVALGVVGLAVLGSAISRRNTKEADI